ncbi:MAG: helix-turn-helix domain-containing protein [Alphaproteobacteria bacterium]|jgi:DNA-directed RNA polymerase subunit E'/Rpb7|nr:helix-turn-helix domain-containing protein [Alphaproteobacteria bacterium]
MKPSFLTSDDLADRWNMPPTTLSQWRWNGRGPEYYKMGKHIRYKIEHVETFEEERRRKNTSIDLTSKKPGE